MTIANFLFVRVYGTTVLREKPIKGSDKLTFYYSPPRARRNRICIFIKTSRAPFSRAAQHRATTRARAT